MPVRLDPWQNIVGVGWNPYTTPPEPPVWTPGYLIVRATARPQGTTITESGSRAAIGFMESNTPASGYGFYDFSGVDPYTVDPVMGLKKIASSASQYSGVWADNTSEPAENPPPFSVETAWFKVRLDGYLLDRLTNYGTIEIGIVISSYAILDPASEPPETVSDVDFPYDIEFWYYAGADVGWGYLTFDEDAGYAYSGPYDTLAHNLATFVSSGATGAIDGPNFDRMIGSQELWTWRHRYTITLNALTGAGVGPALDS